MKKYISLLIAVFLLCSCSQNTAEVTETSVTPSVTYETTTPEETEQAKTEPPITTTSETTVTEITVSETTVTETEEISKNDFYSTDSRVQDYMEQLAALDEFNEALHFAADCLICDMDSNGTPEVVFQIAAHISLSAVFSVDEEGAFMAEPSGGTSFTGANTNYSYDGCIPESFILLGQDQYFAECWVGGSVAGEGGVIKLNLNGRRLSSEYVGQYSYGSKSYTYRGFENEEQYNDYIKTFFGNLEPQWKLMPSVNFNELDVIPNEKYITSLLKEYYSDRDALADLEEQLDDDLSFKTEFKPFYMSMSEKNLNRDYFSSESYTYDYMGNPAENSYGTEMTYTYYPNGRVKTCTTGGSTAEYDENGNIISGTIPDELTYDEKGRVKTRTTYSRDFYNGGYSIHDVTEYFYKDDTEEVIKTIRTYNTNTTETSLYENGLEVSFEWDHDYYAKRIYLKEYTPDGLIAKTEFFDGNKNLARTITYDYDSENRLIREESVTTDFYWDESDRCIDYVFSYKYGDDGKLLLKTHWLGTYNGDTITWEYIYDENGNLIKEIRTNDGDNEMVGYAKGSFVTRYWYEFDLAGNVIKVTSDYEDEYITVTKYRAVRTLTD